MAGAAVRVRNSPLFRFAQNAGANVPAPVPCQVTSFENKVNKPNAFRTVRELCEGDVDNRTWMHEASRPMNNVVLQV